LALTKRLSAGCFVNSLVRVIDVVQQVEMLRLDLSTGKAQKTTDYVAEEVALQISVDKYSFVIWCSPSQFKELAVGYLLSEDILKSVSEVEEITVDETKPLCRIKVKANVDLAERMNFPRRHARVVPLLKPSTSPYQRREETPRVESNLRVKAQTILDCVVSMNTRAKGFVQTGGMHDSAIYRADGSLVAFAEDIGRHNTVDKVIGIGMLDNVDFGECFLTITGRVPGDMIFKAAKVGLPIVTSMCSVLSSGIATAKKANIALVGFVRGKRMNIYTGAERIII
jgi:FdhD protein